ncbi:MAG TPA: chaperone modulator CbpM [Mycobacterium sp.]|nr:chaperone modulator CbpM [Mycobacterium sp.]
MTEPGSDGRYVLARPARLSLDAFARRAGLHPDLVRRFVALGLLPCRRDAHDEVWFEPSAVAVVARIRRLRTGLGLNYAAIGLVLELLDRIDELERQRRPPWTSTG